MGLIPSIGLGNKQGKKGSGFGKIVIANDTLRVQAQ